MKNSKRNLTIIVSIIFTLLLLPANVTAQEDNTDVAVSDVAKSTTDKPTTVTTKDTIKDRLEEKRSELERLRQSKMQQLREQKDVKVMELKQKKEEKTNDLKDKVEVRKAENLAKRQEIYSKRVEFRKKFVLKHVKRIRALINKFMDRVDLMKENGKEVPSSVEADFIVAFDTLTTIENKVNAIDTTSNATTLKELKDEYKQTKTTLENLRSDFADVKTVLQGILSTLKFVNLTNSNSTNGGN